MKHIDKLYHFIAGVILGSIHIYLGIFAGIAKEIYDAFVPYHTADVKDMAATFIGALVGYSLRCLICG